MPKKRKKKTTTANSSSSKRPRASEKNTSSTSSTSSSTTNQRSFSRTLSEHTYPNEGENHLSPGQVTGRRSLTDQFESAISDIDRLDSDALFRFASGDADLDIPTNDSSSNFKTSRQSSLTTFSNMSNQSEIPSNTRQSSLLRGISGYDLDIPSNLMSLSTGSGVSGNLSVPSIPHPQEPILRRGISQDIPMDLFAPTNEAADAGMPPSLQRQQSSDIAVEFWSGSSSEVPNIEVKSSNNRPVSPFPETPPERLERENSFLELQRQNSLRVAIQRQNSLIVPGNQRQESGEDYKQLIGLKKTNVDFNTRVAQFKFKDECHWDAKSKDEHTWIDRIPCNTHDLAKNRHRHNGKDCSTKPNGSIQHSIKRKHSEKKDCKYCTERKEHIKKAAPKQEWRKNKNFHGRYNNKKKSLQPVDAQSGQLDIMFDNVNFGDRLCKLRHEALGDLVLYCQKRARNLPMNREPFPLSDPEIQQRQEALVAYGYRINDYAQWTHKWVHDVAHLPNVPGKNTATITSQEYSTVDQYVHDFFNVGLSKKVSVSVEDVLQLSRDLGMDSLSLGGINPDQYHGSNRDTKMPKRLKAQWTALELANVLRQVGRMEHAASCVRIALNVGNCRGHDKDDLTPEKYLLDKARLMQVRITCVKLNRETDPSLKKTYELELIKMYQTLSTSASKTSDRLQARYQQCEFMFEKAIVEENKEHQVRYVNELKELENLHQQEHEKQTREKEEKKSSSSSTSSTSSSSTSSSTSSSCKYLPSLVSWHHVINSRISATYQCNANNHSLDSNNWKEACNAWKKELSFRKKTYLTGERNRHVVYLNKLLGEHYLKFGKFTEAIKHLESAFAHAIDEHYKIKINALLSKAKAKDNSSMGNPFDGR